MRTDVSIRTVEPVPIAAVVASTTWPEFPAVWRPLLDEVWRFLRGDAPAGLYAHGHNVMLYKDDVPNVEVGVQVTGPFEPVGRVVPSSLPGGLVVTATHSGPIGDLGQTHDAVRAWSSDHGHQLAGVRWEVYGDPDPATGNFDVDVFWAVSDA